jgi:hypothetical protein
MIARIHDIDDEDQPTIEDLRLIIAEVKKFWQMGDIEIVRLSRDALLRVLLGSPKRIRKRQG